MSIAITIQGCETVIAVEGTFDRDAATKLRAILAAAASRATTVIDFSKARAITDTALATLADVLSKDELPLRLRGLSEHHHRMLRFLSPGGGEVAGRDRPPADRAATGVG